MPGGMGFPGMPFDPLALMEYKLKQQAAQQAFENAMRERAMRMQEQQIRQSQMIRQPTMPQMPQPEGRTPIQYRGAQPYGPTSREFSRWGMSPQGVAGSYVDPMDVPVGLRDQIMTGFVPTGSAQQQYTYSTPFQARPSNAAPFPVASGGADGSDVIRAAGMEAEMRQRAGERERPIADWWGLTQRR